MDEVKEKARFIRRLNKTVSFIKEKTRIEKVKRLIEYYYKNNQYISIPVELFDSNDLSDVLRYEEIVNKYFDSSLIKQIIPDGILGLDSDLETYVSYNMHSKYRNKGITMDFSFVPEAIRTKMGDSLEQLKEIYQKENIVHRKSGREITWLDVEKIKFALIKNKAIDDYRSSHPDATKNEILIMYEELFRKQIAKFQGVEIEYNNTMSLDVETFIKYKFFRYDPKEILELENEDVQENRRQVVQGHFEEQKKYLINVLKNLSKNGTLKELVGLENESIRKMNILFSDENKIDELTEEDIFSRVKSFDCSKKNDVLEMLIYTRHFSNKLAHNFEDYIFASTVINSISDKEFLNLKQNKPEEIRKEVLGLYDKWKEEAEKQQNIANVSNNGTANNGSRYHLNVQARNIRESNFKEVAMKYGLENNALKGLLNLKNPRARQILEQQIERKSREFLSEFDTKNDYAYYVFREIRRLRDEYNSIFAESSNNISSGSFKDFVESAFSRRKEFSADFRRFKVSENKKSVATELLKLIERIEKEGVINNPDKVLLFIVGQLDLVENIYDVKHFATMQLLEEHHRNPQKIVMENKKPVVTPTKKENGAVDIYVEGSHQVWGGHYESGDYEALNQYIQSLSSPSDSLNRAFVVNDDSDSLKTFVPQKNLTEAQKIEMRQNLEIFNAINEGKWIDDNGSGKYNRFLEIKNLNQDLFNTLRIRAALGSGLQIFKAQYFDRNTASIPECRLSDAEKEFAENFVKIAFESGFSINEIEKGSFMGLRNPELINYCKKEYDKLMERHQGRQ